MTVGIEHLAAVFGIGLVLGVCIGILILAASVTK